MQNKPMKDEEYEMLLEQAVKAQHQKFYGGKADAVNAGIDYFSLEPVDKITSWDGDGDLETDEELEDVDLNDIITELAGTDSKSPLSILEGEELDKDDDDEDDDDDDDDEEKDLDVDDEVKTTNESFDSPDAEVLKRLMHEMTVLDELDSSDDDDDEKEDDEDDDDDDDDSPELDLDDDEDEGN